MLTSVYISLSVEEAYYITFRKIIYLVIAFWLKSRALSCSLLTKLRRQYTERIPHLYVCKTLLDFKIGEKLHKQGL